MRFWNQGAVSTRLYAAFGAVALIVAAMLCASYLQQARADRLARELTGVEYERMRQVDEWRLMASGTTVRITALNRTQDPAIARMFGPEVGPRIEKINAYRDGVRVWATSDEEQAWFKRMDATGERIMASIGDIAKARAAGDEAAAVEAFEKRFVPETSAYQDMLDQFVGLQRTKLQRSVDALQQAGWTQWAAIAGGLMLALLVVGAMVFGLVRYIARSLDEAVRVAERVAAGDLTVRVQAGGRDEFGTLMTALSGMAGALEQVVRQVRDGTEQIAGASQQIAQGNTDLSQRTEQQAGSLQLTASTMEELSATVRQSADSAGQANALSGRASDVARRGGQAVQQVVQTMGEIEHSSRRIEEIISVIDGISFQTNILALNAAVEAARAGEQGRGFAVVAGEVRTLAQRSANAAKEIKTLIADSSEKVRNGSTQVQTAGTTMEELMQSVQQVTTLIGEISTAADQQRGGIAGVSQSVVELDRATQQNAALVEEAAAAASSLRDQAASLNQAVSVFKVTALA